MRSIVITGVSRGLGAAMFDEFHAAGDRILALGRHFTETQREVAAASGPDQVVLLATDLADPSSLPDAATLAAFCDAPGSGEVVLIHNAAMFEPFGKIGTLPASTVAAAVSINVLAPMLLTNALLSSQKPGRPLAVVYISSSAAHRVAGGRAVYGATKRAGEMFLETLAEEHLADRAVRAVIVDPGIMDTEMQAVVRQHAREDAYFPGRERFLVMHERGEIPSPAAVARKIIEEHLGRAR